MGVNKEVVKKYQHRSDYKIMPIFFTVIHSSRERKICVVIIIMTHNWAENTVN